ncbi:MAG: hypothetical protein M3281_03580 [Chloroflexota bacterium]|nr:hypothetical protein [Chloroflexota bacterium]
MHISTPFTERSIPIHRIQREEAIEQLERWLREREQQAGRTSEEMLEAVRTDESHDSGEIAEWMFWYQTLRLVQS